MRHFIRHYLEMVAAMFLGMFVLGLPAGWLLSALGTSWSQLSPPAMLTAMAVTMTVPMVGWMRVRGHDWQPCLEMTAAMLMPAGAAMALVWSTNAGMAPVMVIEHAGMLAFMLVAMVLRRDEYAGVAPRHSALAAA